MKTTIRLTGKPAINTELIAPMMDKARITLKQMSPTPAVFLRNDEHETAKLKERIAHLEAELSKANTAAAERAQREDRVRSAPGFREVDRRHEWAMKTGSARHQVSVTITGKTVTIADKVMK